MPSAAEIADLFDAATDNRRWPGFSRLVGKAAGIEDVAVWVAAGDQIPEFSIVDTWRDQVEAYRVHFRQLDPWAASLARAAPETVMLGYEHMPEDELLKTEFYNDFARPGGMFRPMGVRLALAPRTFATIGSDLPGARRRFEAADKPRLQRVVPYVKRALQLRLRLGRQAPKLGSAALDALAFGIVVAAADGRIAFANAVAEALAGAGAGITLTGRVVGAGRPADAAKLARLIRDAAGGGAGGIARVAGSAGLLVVLVTPLPRRADGDLGTGYALLSLRPARDEPAFDAATLRQAFGLSPAQAEIAMALFEGHAPEAIAARRGIRISTLRTHLAHIFLRTGARDQRDLVRVLGMLPPLRRRS
ncbi:MAG TPA: hypothetical protein VHD15_00535 [Hyphomicrobiales bacterium]|nr:hypothetical protein [Hyphomicrobiales bacterium]